MSRDAKSVIIVERNQRMREFMHRELLHAGYQVQVLASLDGVRGRLDENPPAVLVVDAELPEVDVPAELAAIAGSHQGLEVILYGYGPLEAENGAAVSPRLTLVEKNGRIDGLLGALAGATRRQEPGREGGGNV